MLMSATSAPMPSPRMNDALRPMRSEMMPAGMDATAPVMPVMASRSPMNDASKPMASRYKLNTTPQVP
jgi:hypothetical protein